MDYIIGRVDMPFETFYQSDCSIEVLASLTLAPIFEPILKRHPARNPRVQSYLNNHYLLKQVPVYLPLADYLALKNKTDHPLYHLIQEWDDIQVVNADEVFACKYKRLLADGSYGKREYIGKKRPKQVPFPLKITVDYYQFMHYSYAAEIAFASDQVESYEAFDQLYGKYIYSVIIRINDQVIPLLWLDYLYHVPENHLEFGFLKTSENFRYQLLNQWQAGDRLSIEILADGFEDVCLVTELKANLGQSISVEEKEEGLTFQLPAVLAKAIYPSKDKGSWYVENRWQLLPGEWIDGQTWLVDKKFLFDLPRYQVKWLHPVYGTYLTVGSVKNK